MNNITSNYQQPLVTVITPTYNCAAFLKETIDSILHQTYTNIKYIIIDDGSTDATKLILKEVTDPRVSIYHNRNQGEQRTVNRGLMMVNSKYFMIVNADDPLLPKAVEELVKFMDMRPRILCAYPDWVSIDENSHAHLMVQCRDWDFAYMVSHHVSLPSVGAMFRTKVIELIGLRDESFRWLGDFDYWFRIGLVGEMAHVPQTLACWRARKGQASGAHSDRRADEHVRIIRKIYNAGLQELFKPQALTPGFGMIFYSKRDSLMEVQREAYCWSHIVAATIAKSRRRVFTEAWSAVKIYPRILIDVGAWDAFVRRAFYILRR